MRLFLRLLLGAWLAVSGGLLLIFCLTPYAELAQGWQLPNYAVPPFARLPPPSGTEYRLLRSLLATAAGFGALAFWWTFIPALPPTTKPRLRAGIGRIGTRLRRLLGHYPAVSLKLFVLFMLLIVLGGRAAYLQQVPIDVNGAGAFPSLDEIASYDYFTRPGPAVAASYYQLPNNHVAHNLLASAFTRLLPAPPATSSGLLIRLPAIVSGLLGLLLSFALLRRYAGLLSAMLGAAAFHLLPLAVSYAVMGRGYALEFTCAVMGTWAALRLLGSTGDDGHALAWAVFVLVGVVGLYAVPSHLHTVLAQGLVVLVFLARSGRQRGAQLRQLVVAAGFGLALTLLLYAPVLLLSGWRALVDNLYVQPRPAALFWASLGPALRSSAAELFGQASWSSGLYLALMVVFPFLWPQSKGALPADAWRLGWMAYGQAVAPIPLMVIQRQLAPARTLLPATFFTLVTAALLLQLLWPALRRRLSTRTRATTWLRPRAYGWQLVIALGVLLPLSIYRFGRVRAVLAGKAREGAQVQAAYNWLRNHTTSAKMQHDNQVVVSLRSVAVAWHHRALVTGQAPLPLVVAEYPDQLPAALNSHPIYFAIGHTDDIRPGSAWAPFTRGLELRYRDATLSIYAVPPRQQHNPRHK